MQIKVVFYKEGDIILPLDYNHIVQAFIYRIIDEKLSAFLHDFGFGESRKFKMFTFSRLFGKYSLKKKPGFIIFENEVSLTVSSPYGAFCQSFANGIIKKKIFLGDNELEVVRAEINPIEIKKEEIIIETLSPIVVYSTLLKPEGSKYTVYFHPEENEFVDLLSKNLCKKYRVWKNENYEDRQIFIKPLRPPKLNLVRYKDFIIKGYSSSFKITGPIELLQIGIEAGFGSKNSMGFGCVRVKN